ncbi:DUF4886 domain-containing protein [Arcticibacterium luteifluviistationis]|uniref:DUF4886 domain-containing protein n=2 Tax=Arcticibacterium luteifluviistationis TaxID=1784714 RepID=A0A2Z4GGN0_9BACT|nr:DUF4886 domain-containing protein [Arcticibacterium luteifluviistationis]
MKSVFLFILILFAIDCFAQKAEKVNVLFIGNSLTYFHDMPQTLQLMLNETNPNIKVEQSTFPGISLSGHIEDVIVSRTENGIRARKKNSGELSETERKIGEKKWDIIILQEGTVRLLIPEVRKYKVETAIAAIKERVTNPDCKFILFKTWPLKGYYPQEYCYSKFSIKSSLPKDEYCSPLIESFEQELDLINDSYDLVAINQSLICSENANKFYEVLMEFPDVELYEDDMHPNENGAFLNACIFYQMLTGKKASVLKYTGAINLKTAEILKGISD